MPKSSLDDTGDSDYCPFTDIILECGAIASFDHSSGCSYICNDCFAVVGSMGMPKHCKELDDMAQIANKLRGRK